ncbi:hypothetical protein L9F63_000074, partial [Diploptera punctata]
MLNYQKKRSVILKRSDSFNSHYPVHSNGAICNKDHENGVTLKNYKTKSDSVEQCSSTEFSEKEQRNYLDSDNKEVNVNGVFCSSQAVNGKTHLCRSISNSSTISASDSDDLSNCIRNVGNKSNFYRSISLSRGSSIEEENEDRKSVDYRRRVSCLVDELLLDIYGKWYSNGMGLSFHKRRHSSSAQESDCCSTSGGATAWKIQSYLPSTGTNDVQQRARLNNKSLQELVMLVSTLRADVQYAGAVLARQLKRRDALVSRQEKQNDVLTAVLQAMSEKR